MKKVEAFCDNCITEFSVELVDNEVVVKYCPVCGSALEDEVETIEISPANLIVFTIKLGFVSNNSVESNVVPTSIFHQPK
jgi:Zn finger protein HypA/HybF involved in hydrogenase expression